MTNSNILAIQVDKREYNRYRESLAKQIHGISPIEIKIGAYIALEMNSYQIANVLQTSEQVVNNHRSDIRRKMGLDKRASLETALLAIVSLGNY